jgi:hypothetical protein
VLHENNWSPVWSLWIFDSEKAKLVTIFGCDLVALVIQTLILSELKKVLEEIRVLSFLILLGDPSTNRVFSRVDSQNE